MANKSCMSLKGKVNNGQPKDSLLSSDSNKSTVVVVLWYTVDTQQKSCTSGSGESIKG